jgi:hypothetical protein
MTLKRFVEEVLDPRIFRPRPLPKKSRMAEIAEKIATQREAAASSFSPFDVGVLLNKLRAIAKNAAWAELSDREFRHVPNCLWLGEPRLSTNAAFLNSYFRALRGRRSRLATKGLVWVYLMHFDAEAPEIVGIGRHLAGEVGYWKWEWAERHRRFAMFDAGRGASDVARAALEEESPRRVLETAGLLSSLASSRFALACFHEAAKETQRRLGQNASHDHVQRLSDWVLGADGRFAIKSARTHFAEALLTPWSNGDPPEELKDKIRGILLNAFGDPRIEHGAWTGVSDSAKNVMFRWLARASLEQFLAVVDRTALEHQWEFRRAFWRAYIDRDHVKDAWVVFGPAGRARAKELARETKDPGMLSFGSLRGGSSDHAVLLLRIGDLVVADWSHNGTLRIWSERNGSAPKLYASEYYATHLRQNSDFDQRHLGDWQRPARDFIQRRTGIRIAEHEYMPRGRRR